MRILKFISIFRWQVICLHLFAVWCFVMAAQMLFFVKYREVGIITDRFSDLDNWRDAISLSWIALWAFYFPYLGLLFAFIISLIIVRRLRFNLLNAFIVLFIGYLSIRFFWLFWKDLKWKCFKLGSSIFDNMLVEFMIKTGIFLILGFMIFLFSYKYEKNKAATEAA